MLDDSCNSFQVSTGGFNAQLFQSSADCIKILDLDGRVVGLNKGGVSALELDDPTVLHGHQWSDFWPEESKRAVDGAVVAGRVGTHSQFAAFCPTAKGTARWWDVVVSPILNDEGAVSQLMVVSRDVTELHLARAALHDADRRKDEFLAMLSHELCNPLSAAGMAATVLQTQAQALAPARVAEIGNLIQRQVAYMSRMAEDLLDVSRVTRGDVSMKMAPVQLNDVLREVIEQLQPTYAAKGQQVEWQASDATCIVLGDKTRLIQVVGNLLANSIRYTPQAGHIDIRLQRERESITLAISDTGIGISPADLPTLFDLYKQGAGAGNERKAGGLGIGLALVRSLVELHGGSVAAFSEGAGSGSTFTVEFPAYSR